MNTTAQNLSAHRQMLGLSYATVRDRVRDILGDGYTPTEQTIRNYHTGETAKMDVIVLTALAEVYGTTTKALAPEKEGEVDTIRDLLSRAVGCLRDIPAHANSPAMV